jgi:hypothetical protein
MVTEIDWNDGSSEVVVPLSPPIVLEAGSYWYSIVPLIPGKSF